MKKILITILFIFIFHSSRSQDLINWYKDWEGSDIFELNAQIYNLAADNIQPGYDGEYVILATDMNWVPDRLLPALGSHVLNNMYMTYQIEIASFPFSPECAFIGCANTSNRNLKMPDDLTYSTFLEAWEYSGPNPFLYNISPEKEFQNFSNGNWISDQSMPHSLASGSYDNPSQFSLDRIVLPHTILKHTLRLRCARNILAPVLSSIVFYTDLTRGTMREYPFIPTNSGNNAITHDVIIKPGIIHDYGNYSSQDLCAYGYAEIGSNCGTNQPDWYGDILNYTPFDISDDDNLCFGFPTSYLVNSQTDPAFNASQFGSNLTRLSIPNYSLVVSTGVRDWEGYIPAGYILPAQTSILQRIEPNYFQHEYFIDKNIDLSKINSTDKIIFNPSEIHVTAPDLKFPTNYTFKTISGRYPYLPEVLSQNTIENGGPYNEVDPSDPNYIVNLNTETDLFKDFHVNNNLYPDDDHKYASIYHLDNNGKITIEPCVRIFDAVFEINPGSEIVFENWKTNQINVNRYQLIMNGGKVTKCDDQFLFQNQIEDKKILIWKAGDFIKAGKSVDVSSMVGNYKVVSGAQEQFIANNYIDLEEGFDIESGAIFEAKIETVTIPACGPLRLRRQDDTNYANSPNKVPLSYFECSPNPINDNSVCMFKIGDISNVTLQVYNSLGQLVTTICEEKQLPAGSYSYNLNKSEFKSGIYYAKLYVNAESKSLKFIKP